MKPYTSRFRGISKHGINEEFVIRVIFYFGGSFLPLRQSKAFYKFGFFDGIFGDFQKKHEFATPIKNTSTLPRDFMDVSVYRKFIKNVLPIKT